MADIKVVVNGALGKMGQTIVDTLKREPGIEVVGGVDVKAAEGKIPLDAARSIPLSSNLENILTSTKPDVLVDFTIPAAVMGSVRTTVKHGVNLVIGTTGLKPENIAEIKQLAEANNICAFVAPNFALGAVLMMAMAKLGAKFFDTAEIIELHHDQKLDAPSGTALATAKMMADAKGIPFNRPKQLDPNQPSRGMVAEGINVHSVRLPGFVAHQEVIFGGIGQTLTIRHDSTGRDSFLPGIILAIKGVGKHKGLTYGLDQLLGL
jgi:4-hydroxy-tetrahydrodipicolinate reductase